MANEKETTSGMEDSGLKKGREDEQKKPGQTRRAFVVGAAGLVVGGVVGYNLAGTGSISLSSVPYPSLWIGRNPESCTGCKLCEIACSQIKEEGAVWPAASRIRVYQYPPCVEFPVACYQCGPDSQCIQACEVDALAINPEYSTIDVDLNKCLRTKENLGCVLCAEACPGKTIFFHPQTSAPLVCDLCGGEPACVDVCPSNTIMIKGTSMAAAPPEEIARTLGHMYDLPISRKDKA